MDINEFKIEIGKRLSGDFEHDLFNAALYNLNDVDNKLRFNNFAYSLRELTRHILARLAPDKNVLNTAWFIPATHEKPKQITRKQRMKYAIQGGLLDVYVTDVLGIDVDEIGKKVNDSIDLLSKYTHINPESFYIQEVTIRNFSKDAIKAVLLLFQTIDESRSLLINKLETHIDKSIIDNLFYETIDTIDCLATHYNIENYSVNNIKLLGIDDTTVYFKAEGYVGVKLQYGSDGDLRRGDGMTMYESFPFTGDFYGRIKDRMEAFELNTETFEVDTDCHWGEIDIDKEIEKQ